jgi:ribosomal-protein-alanine N-acetyltransferase
MARTRKPKKLEPVPVHIRWMIRRDMEEVMAIENHKLRDPWQEEDFLKCLRQRNCIGMVAETKDGLQSEPYVRGFMVYCLEKNRLEVLNMAVHRNWKHRDIGTAMMDKLKSKLSSHRRTSIHWQVSETNLAGQLFLKSQGFRATKVIRDEYEDLFYMVFNLNGEFEDVRDFMPVNRVEKFCQEEIRDE